MLFQSLLPAVGLFASLAVAGSSPSSTSISAGPNGGNGNNGGSGFGGGPMSGGGPPGAGGWGGNGGGWANGTGWGFGGGWGSGNNGNWGMGGQGVCSKLSNDKNAQSSAWSCVSSAVSSLMATKTGDQVWSSCNGMMMTTPTTTGSADSSYNSCQCSWLLGPQGNCICPVCSDADQYSSYVSSVSSAWGCTASPTDAPTVSNGIVYAANAGKPTGSPGLARQTGAPMAVAAGVAGMVALLV